MRDSLSHPLSGLRLYQPVVMARRLSLPYRFGLAKQPPAILWCVDTQLFHQWELERGFDEMTF